MKTFVDESHDPLAVFLLASQLLTIEMLRQPIEFAQYLSIRCIERLGEAEIVALVGSKRDSYDCTR